MFILLLLIFCVSSYAGRLPNSAMFFLSKQTEMGWSEGVLGGVSLKFGPCQHKQAGHQDP